MAFGTTTEHVLTFIRRGAIKPIIPFSQGVHVPRTVLTSQNYEKEINNSVYAMIAFFYETRFYLSNSSKVDNIGNG